MGLRHGHLYQTQHGLHQQQWESIELSTQAAHRRLSLQIDFCCAASRETTSAWVVKPRDEDRLFIRHRWSVADFLKGHMRCTADVSTSCMCPMTPLGVLGCLFRPLCQVSLHIAALSKQPVSS